MQAVPGVEGVKIEPHACPERICFDIQCLATMTMRPRVDSACM